MNKNHFKFLNNLIISLIHLFVNLTIFFFKKKITIFINLFQNLCL